MIDCMAKRKVSGKNTKASRRGRYGPKASKTVRGPEWSGKFHSARPESEVKESRVKEPHEKPYNRVSGIKSFRVTRGGSGIEKLAFPLTSVVTLVVLTHLSPSPLPEGSTATFV